MMPVQYLILASGAPGWNEAFVRSLVFRTAMSVAYQSDNLIALVNDPSEMLLTPDGNGFIVGKLFRASGEFDKIDAFTREEAETIGRDSRLVSQYWGSYVSAFRTDREVGILRDPLGGLPCYYTSSRGLTAFVSDAPILEKAGLLRPLVDLAAVGRTLYFSQLPTEGTAISGLKQLLPGQMITLADHETNLTQQWSPWDHMAPRASEDLHTRSERLEHVIRRTHAAWAKCYPRSLIGLSGGLDSSIVAVCLAEACETVHCLTAVTSDPVGDERLYARMICDQTGTAFHEKEYADAAIEMGRSVAEGVPIPNGKTHEMAYNRVVREAARRLNVDAFFVGAGGDNVFYLTHSARPIVDRYLAEGISKNLYATILDICSITGASFWQAISEAVRIGIRGRRRAQIWHVDTDYLDRELVANAAESPVQHPWLRAPKDASYGKLGHVAMILRALHHIEHRDKQLTVPMISPLLSQPIVEACLAIPSWEACHGGQDRSAARRAFSAALPSRVVGRRGKGSPDGFVGGFIRHHCGEIADRLLNGHLATNRLIDRQALEIALRPTTPLQRNDCARIMELLDAEAWIDHWSSTSRDRA